MWYAACDPSISTAAPAPSRQRDDLGDGIDACRARSTGARPRRSSCVGVSSRSNSSITRSPRSSIGTTFSVAPVALAEQLPRHDVRVVLHRRDEHLVAGADVGVAPGARDQVDALGGVAREDDLAHRPRVDERAHLLARAFVRRRSRARSACARRDGRWRCRARSSAGCASITCRGFCVVAALSR